MLSYSLLVYLRVFFYLLWLPSGITWYRKHEESSLVISFKQCFSSTHSYNCYSSTDNQMPVPMMKADQVPTMPRIVTEACLPQVVTPMLTTNAVIGGTAFAAKEGTKAIPPGELAVRLVSVAIEGLTDEELSDSGGEGMYRERDEFVVRNEDIETLKVQPLWKMWTEYYYVKRGFLGAELNYVSLWQWSGSFFLLIHLCLNPKLWRDRSYTHYWTCTFLYSACYVLLCFQVTMRTGNEPPAIWKVQKALLQKFVPELRDGKRVFSATNSVSKVDQLIPVCA